MTKNYYIVTCINSGWDNVRGLYLAESEQAVLDALVEDYGNDAYDDYIIHGPKRLEEI